MTTQRSGSVRYRIYVSQRSMPEQEKHDLSIIIEEVLRQRCMEGVKNEEGVWIIWAFPKLIYVLEEDNITEDFTSTLPSWLPSARQSAWFPTTSPRRRCAN